jgi:hypothetical protein
MSSDCANPRNHRGVRGDLWAVQIPILIFFCIHFWVQILDKSRFQPPCQFRRAPFLDDLPGLHTSLTQSLLADCRSPLRKLCSSSSSIRLPHAIRMGMIAKHSPFVPSVFRFCFPTEPSSLKAQHNSRFRQKSGPMLSPKCHNHYSVYRHETHKYSLGS